MEKRRVRFSIKPRFWALLLVVACIFTSVSMAREGAALNVQRVELERLKQRRQELRCQCRELKREVEFSQTDAFIERQARAMGMIMPGEVRYVLDTEVAAYAQGGN